MKPIHGSVERKVSHRFQSTSMKEEFGFPENGGDGLGGLRKQCYINKHLHQITGTCASSLSSVQVKRKEYNW